MMFDLYSRLQKSIKENKFKLFCKSCDDMVETTGEGRNAKCIKCGKLINPQIAKDDINAQETKESVITERQSGARGRFKRIKITYDQYVKDKKDADAEPSSILSYDDWLEEESERSKNESQEPLIKTKGYQELKNKVFGEEEKTAVKLAKGKKLTDEEQARIQRNLTRKDNKWESKINEGVEYTDLHGRQVYVGSMVKYQGELCRVSDISAQGRTASLTLTELDDSPLAEGVSLNHIEVVESNESKINESKVPAGNVEIGDKLRKFGVIAKVSEVTKNVEVGKVFITFTNGAKWSVPIDSTVLRIDEPEYSETDESKINERNKIGSKVISKESWPKEGIKEGEKGVVIPTPFHSDTRDYVNVEFENAGIHEVSVESLEFLSKNESKLNEIVGSRKELQTKLKALKKPSENAPESEWESYENKKWELEDRLKKLKESKLNENTWLTNKQREVDVSIDIRGTWITYDKEGKEIQTGMQPSREAAIKDFKANGFVLSESKINEDNDPFIVATPLALRQYLIPLLKKYGVTDIAGLWHDLIEELKNNDFIQGDLNKMDGDNELGISPLQNDIPEDPEQPNDKDIYREPRGDNGIDQDHSIESMNSD